MCAGDVGRFLRVGDTAQSGDEFWPPKPDPATAPAKTGLCVWLGKTYTDPAAAAVRLGLCDWLQPLRGLTNTDEGLCATTWPGLDPAERGPSRGLRDIPTLEYADRGPPSDGGLFVWPTPPRNPPPPLPPEYAEPEPARGLCIWPIPESAEFGP